MCRLLTLITLILSGGLALAQVEKPIFLSIDYGAGISYRSLTLKDDRFNSSFERLNEQDKPTYSHYLQFNVSKKIANRWSLDTGIGCGTFENRWAVKGWIVSFYVRAGLLPETDNTGTPVKYISQRNDGTSTFPLD